MNPINNDYWVPQARFYSTRFYFTRFRLQYSSTVQCHSVKTLRLAVLVLFFFVCFHCFGINATRRSHRIVPRLRRVSVKYGPKLNPERRSKQ